MAKDRDKTGKTAGMGKLPVTRNIPGFPEQAKLGRKQQQALNDLAAKDPEAVLRVMRQWMQERDD